MIEASEAAQAAAHYDARRSTYVDAADAYRVLVAQLVAKTRLAVDSVTARAKDTQSVLEKLREGDYEGIEDLTDLVGVRVVARYSADVPHLCETLIPEFDVLEDVNHRATSPDAFGYSSRHLIVRLKEPRSALPEWQDFSGQVVEIQVRSILEHAWASISHGLDYKSGNEVPAEVRRQLFRVAALLETSDELFDTFRESVTTLREAYRGDVAAQQWRDLPVNLDSLSAALESVGLERLADAAVAEGWRKLTTAPDKDRAAQRMGKLIEAAITAGITTLGGLADEIEAIAADREGIADLATHAGQPRPIAVPEDVATMLIEVRHPQIPIRSWRPNIVDAIDQLRAKAIAEIPRDASD